MHYSSELYDEPVLNLIKLMVIANKGSHLVKVDFNKFRITHPNSTEAFQDLCYQIFCRRYKLEKGIFSYKNQPGIETEPILNDAVFIGFQSKFFEKEISSAKFIEGLRITKRKYPHIQKVLFFTNLEFSAGRKEGDHRPGSQKSIEVIAKELEIEIEWVVPSHFSKILNNPENTDLAEMFFGLGDYEGFISSGTNLEIQAFLQSNEYLALKLFDGKTVIIDSVKHILNTARKSFLVVGNPGSGKSMLMHYLFRELSGLGYENTEDKRSLWIDNQAIPMIINLKNCSAQALEDLIRMRKDEFNLTRGSLGYIYILDGLDELTPERADHVLLCVKELEQRQETKKIVISCRTGNINRISTRNYLSQVFELTFQDVDVNIISAFFKNKGDLKKNRILASFKKNSPTLLGEIKDIFLVKLLWETIGTLSPTSTIIDLIEQRINILLSFPKSAPPNHLNLLNAKADQIILLNQRISFEFQKEFQLRFPQKRLQLIISEMFPKCDYKDINDIISYQCEIFFDRSDTKDIINPDFIYKHRRYQEFFFAKCLKAKYEQDPSILRQLDVLSDSDFFNELFLPYLRKEYEKEENIVELLGLNLIQYYLNVSSDDFSFRFIDVIASLKSRFANELLESEVFHLKEIIFIDLKPLESLFKDVSLLKENNQLMSDFISLWRGVLSSYLTRIVTFWEKENKVLAKKLLDKLSVVRKIFSESKTISLLVNSNSWESLENYFFVLVCIERRDCLEICKSVIEVDRKLSKSPAENFSKVNKYKNEYLKTFLTALLSGSDNLLSSVVKMLDAYQLTILFELLFCSEKFYTVFLKNTRLQEAIRSLLVSNSIKVSVDGLYVCFYKRFLGVLFDNSELSLIRSILAKLYKEGTNVSNFTNNAFKFAAISFALDENTFESLKIAYNKGFKHYHELNLYSALFTSFVKLTQSDRSISYIIREYLSYIEHNYRPANTGFNWPGKSFLWAEIFNASYSAPVETLIISQAQLLTDGTYIVPESFYFHLASINKALFDKIVNQSDLLKLEELLSTANDFPALTDRLFSLALFYSNLDEEKSKSFFVNALKNNLLRHEWRKDTLVSYQLVESLDVLWKNNWESKSGLTELTQRVFKLTIRASEMTDGKGTWRGPYNVIQLVSKYDYHLAELLKNELVKNGHSGNYINIATTSVLLGKIRFGVAWGDLEEEILQFESHYNVDGVDPDIYIQHIRVYLAVAESDLYDEEVKLAAFSEAYNAVEELKKSESFDYHRKNDDFPELTVRYIKLCKKYNKRLNLEIDNEDSVRKVSINATNRKKIAEAIFIRSLMEVKNKRQLKVLYKKLDSYDFDIVLKKRLSWEKLLEKTHAIMGNIELFIVLLRRFNYPHIDYMTQNSKYIHFGIVRALSNIEMKGEMMRYIYKGTGHGGFSNMMRVYAEMNDKEMCRKLLNRYMQICHLLLD